MSQQFQGKINPSVFIEKTFPSGYYIVKNIDIPGSKRMFDDKEEAYAYFSELEDAE